ncbi:hypothetical protein [Burkholderia oklahomensis]|nr:hypothetical protein [Burkholderia oklahomensis]AJX31777.1 hypothetical protein BG90_684 [Burkholderia oklahomensis C6786]MBI0360514.1 hypothetical protein [Burkholderia oklahomensis]SUW59891.1 Uncharacterised protein [Burkholderia oklahomensis]
MQHIVLFLQNALSLKGVLLGLAGLVLVGGLAYAIRSIRLFMKIGNDE